MKFVTSNQKTFVAFVFPYLRWSNFPYNIEILEDKYYRYASLVDQNIADLSKITHINLRIHNQDVTVIYNSFVGIDSDKIIAIKDDIINPYYMTSKLWF